jgi:DNA-binding transcriptional regulator YiaG
VNHVRKPRRQRAPSFGAQVKAWREYFGLSKPMLADRIGVTPEAVIMWESGATAAASATNQSKLVRVLGISQAAFWGPVPTRPER